MKKINYSFITAFSATILLVFPSCNKNTPDTSGLYTPTSADVTSSASLSDLQQGRALYVNNCGVCHGLYSPDSHNPSQWKSTLARMAPNTNMSGAQVQLVSKYLCRGH